MIDSARLLKDLTQQLKLLVADLRSRTEEPDNPWAADLRETHRIALERGRTGLSWVAWRDNEIDQAAVAWIVATTFVRFCEDNHLLDGARGPDSRPVPTLWIAGPDVRTDRAMENQTEFFRANPLANRRDWLHEAFRVLAAQPAGRGLVDPGHNPVWTALISADAADRLVDFWRTDDGAGNPVHDFTDEALDTRFLGDLYQDLSEHAKKTYALLQTPVFVEEFILDQTLDPAVREFGLTGLKVIDPTCGSGHFLLGAFERLQQKWLEEAPGLDARERVRRAMDSIHGVDLNPFAVSIARFRLTVAALKATGDRSLVDMSKMPFHLAVGDSLLGGGGVQGALDLSREDEVFEYATEDVSEYRDILDTGQYHVVVGNPPYITVKDKTLNQRYRELYPTCKGKYALSVPFMELFFRLAVAGGRGEGAGFVGQITSNSFMKREFGSKLIEQFLSGQDLRTPVDLTAVIDTSGAYIPGHGTPTVILIGRRSRPQLGTVRAVLGVRGEPGQPADASKGVVWAEIVERLEEPGYDGTYVSVADLDRASLSTHPWSMSGGGAADVMARLGVDSPALLNTRVDSIGFAAVTGDDDVFIRRLRTGAAYVDRVPMRAIVDGDRVRDFLIRSDDLAVFPYPVERAKRAERVFWPYRTNLRSGLAFQQTREDRGMWWGEYILPNWPRLDADYLITFAEVSTHNHFVLNRGGKVFNRTAPVIKLPESATERDHLDLLAVLNSSTVCFWLKQVSHNKGSTVDAQGARQTQVPWEDFYQFGSTKVGMIPLPGTLPGVRSAVLDELARLQSFVTPRAALRDTALTSRGTLEHIPDLHFEWDRLRSRLVFEQEELDWEVYRLYELIDDDLTYSGDSIDRIDLGERAFEIALARRVADGTEESAWFERHGSTPRTEIPAEWPEDYRALVQRRLDLIASDPHIALLEKPEHKRRWATPGWDALLRDAARDALLDRLEAPELWDDGNGPLARSVGELASALRHDAFVRDLATILTGTTEHDLTAVLTPLVADEAVPYLAAHRYKDSGIEKYRAWQETWNLQRREDAGEDVTIAVPPKYTSADFRKPAFWKARGKLDVPKERFVAYPGVGRPGDRTAVVGWAGWDHAQQAQALARELTTLQAQGADPTDLVPLLAGLVELEPWLRQWHGDVVPEFGMSPAAAIGGLVDGMLQQLGTTRADLDAWRPAPAARGRRPRAS
ncbi:BREX-2 system adenine-specific DNA-methyltransferase PglX [Cellulosimicrobium funkei]